MALDRAVHRGDCVAAGRADDHRNPRARVTWSCSAWVSSWAMTIRIIGRSIQAGRPRGDRVLDPLDRDVQLAVEEPVLPGDRRGRVTAADGRSPPRRPRPSRRPRGGSGCSWYTTSAIRSGLAITTSGRRVNARPATCSTSGATSRTIHSTSVWLIADGSDPNASETSSIETCMSRPSPDQCARPARAWKRE